MSEADRWKGISFAVARTNRLLVISGENDTRRMDTTLKVDITGGSRGKWRVLIVDSDARVRRGLRALLECESDIVVVGEAATAEQALQCDITLHPGVVLLDLMLPTVGDGLETVRLLAAKKRVCVAICWRDNLKDAVFKMGACGFVEKGAPPEIVLAAIRAVCRDGHQLRQGKHKRQ